MSGTITVWIDGIAASAATYIAMEGDEIVMPENAFLMIHDPSGIVMGTAADMRDMPRLRWRNWSQQQPLLPKQPCARLHADG
ncbi:ATP-dependent Clp protease proteolytic subunit [Yoonia sp.]|jgi:ATP-dependent protease ClpP protease subunit|uniref:ATP-dependent Clp protease proteolytic subunit n=1 Tax=Yoonia sp. TaxID=2212373 RepID=UPI0040487E5B